MTHHWNSLTHADLSRGIDIPLGTALQYRCTGGCAPCIHLHGLPPWPGDDEAVIMDGPWAVLRVTDRGDYWRVDCNACDGVWQVPHHVQESVE